PADRAGGGPDGRQDVEGRRGPEKDQPVDALRDRRVGGRSGLGVRDLRRVAAGRGGGDRTRVPHSGRLLLDDRRDLRDVAGRADHGAWHWEWRELDDLLLD